jgi:hypothetical protein
MNYLIIPQNRLGEVDNLNAETQMCDIVETSSGVLLTCSDKIGDPFWANWQTFLLSLEVFQGEPIWKTEEE